MKTCIAHILNYEAIIKCHEYLKEQRSATYYDYYCSMEKEFLSSVCAVSLIKNKYFGIFK